jgi:hypothetical protein
MVIETRECEIQYRGCTGVGTLREDPFLAEVHDEHVDIWVCDHCLQELADDI